MGWQTWVVPLIVIIVAVLASVFRGAEEAKRRANQRERGGREPRRERPRSESSGIDQFLEEIRRRQAARQESAESAQREMSRPREPEPAPPPLPVRIEPPPRRREPRIVRVEPVEIPVAVLAEVPVAPAPPPAPPPAATTVTPRREAAATAAVRTQLAAMLKSKTGLQVALIAREIFEEPLCRRRTRPLPARSST